MITSRPFISIMVIAMLLAFCFWLGVQYGKNIPGTEVESFDIHPVPRR